jgi:hypothetical protein
MAVCVANAEPASPLIAGGEAEAWGSERAAAIPVLRANRRDLRWLNFIAQGAKLVFGGIN